MNLFAPDEAWWAATHDHRQMLAHLATANAPPRKWRLFLCACARERLPFLTDPDCRDALEVAEQYADAAAPRGALVRASGTIATALRRGPVGQFRSALDVVRGAVEVDDGRMIDAARQWWGKDTTADLIRDVFGFPFHRAAFPAAWRTSTAVGLARAMYESRDFAAMPVLADALEEAGCDRPDVLAHCRGGGSHVRGCWVVDLVLGKG